MRKTVGLFSFKWKWELRVSFSSSTDPVKIKVVDLQQLEEAGQLSSDNFAAGLEFQNLGLLR